MSKGNMLLGFARGKVGDLVFSRTNGQQVTRAKATHIKNPQTESQMIQRIILNTISQAYSRFSAICDHSFEGIQSGQKSMSYFQSKNIENLRNRLVAEIAEGYDLGSIYAFTPIGSNEYASNEYVIAKGTLPSVAVGFTSAANTAEFAVTENTYQGVLDALGLERGDQLTFVATQGTSGQNTAFHYARIILDPTNADGTPADLSSTFIDNGAVNLPSPRNTGVFNTIACDGSKVTFNFSARPITGAAVIVSRQAANGSWLRSNTTLSFDVSAVAGWQLSMQECLDLFATGGVETLNSRYLNNAGEGRLASAGASSVQATTKAGATVTLLGLTSEIETVTGAGDKSYVKAYDAEGNKYAIRNTMSSSRTYGQCLTSLTGWSGDAWFDPYDDITDAEQVVLSGYTGNLWDWLVAHGASYTIWMDGNM